MKTETQIAKENVKLFDETDANEFQHRSKEHFATCQRFLEFLKEAGFNIKVVEMKIDDLSREKKIPYPYTRNLNLLFKDLEKEKLSFNNKITDLQNAIKIYEDGGVK